MMMALPNEIGDLVRAQGLGEPHLALRSSYDLQGGLGETYVIADAATLLLLTRRLGETWQPMAYPAAHITSLAIIPDGLYQNLELVTPDRKYAIRSSSWNQLELDRLAEWWRARHPDADTPAAPSPTRDIHGGEASNETPPAPSTLFCASLRAVAEADGTLDTGELECIARVTGQPAWLEAGVRFYARHGLAPLLAWAGRTLDRNQARCLLANGLAVAMADGWLRGAEQELLEQFRAALGLDTLEFEHIQEAIMTKNRLAVFAEESPPPAAEGLPSGLVLFCAAVKALASAEVDLGRAELARLTGAIEDPGAWRQAHEYLAGHSWETLVADLNRGLTAAQKRCLVANLAAAVISVDAPQGTKQAWLEQVAQALGIAAAEYLPLLEVLRAKANTRVFAS